MYEIVAREDFSDVTYLLEIEHPQLAQAAQPGQFVIVVSHELGERIPLTIADFDRKKGTITLVVQAVGKTTKEMQLNCQKGTKLYALVGPMGLPTHISDAEKVVCVGGGLGVAPVFPQLRAYKEKGAYVIGVIGFRSQDLIFWKDKFEKYCDELIICTDDGTAGIKGLVTDGIKAAMEKHSDIDELIAIGPPIMMKFCAGTGMCGGCRVSVGGKMKFACVDGPDFDGHEVDFDELMSRLGRFVEDENLAMEKWSEDCRLMQKT